MTLQALPYTAVDMLAALLAGGAAVVAWRRRHSPGGLALAVALLCVCWWCLWHGLSLEAPTFAMKVLCLQVAMPGHIGAPWALLMFAVQYLRNERRSHPFWIVLAAMDPIFGTLAFWASGWHHLFWTPYLDAAGPFPSLGFTYGPLFVAALIPAYTAVVVSAVLIMRVAFVNRGLFRWQASLLLAGSLLPMVAGGFFDTGHSPIRNLNLAPPSLAVGVSLVAWALFSHRLLDIVPIAQSMIIDSISDAVILLDKQDRVIYLNRSAQGLVSGGAKVVGQTIGAAFGERAAQLAQSAELDQESRHLTLVLGMPERTFDVLISPLRDKAGQAQGRAVVMRDVTPRELISQLQRSRRQIIAAEEHVRLQIAEMLHGTVQSKLLAVSFQLGHFEVQWSGSEAESQELLSIRDALDRVSEHDVRRASDLLYPSVIRFGLLPAVRELADGFRPVFEVQVIADAALDVRDEAGGEGVDDGIRLTAYRLIEEALSNAAKHAGARSDQNDFGNYRSSRRYRLGVWQA